MANKVSRPITRSIGDPEMDKALRQIMDIRARKNAVIKEDEVLAGAIKDTLSAYVEEFPDTSVFKFLHTKAQIVPFKTTPGTSVIRLRLLARGVDPEIIGEALKGEDRWYFRASEHAAGEED
jgi:hypothetical protein